MDTPDDPIYPDNPAFTGHQISGLIETGVLIGLRDIYTGSNPHLTGEG